jgi:hypothetical protein
MVTAMMIGAEASVPLTKCDLFDRRAGPRRGAGHVAELLLPQGERELRLRLVHPAAALFDGLWDQIGEPDVLPRN